MKTWLVLGACVVLVAVASPARAQRGIPGPVRVLESAPLGTGGTGADFPLVFEASIVNVGLGPVVASIQFCDSGGNCVQGNQVFCQGLVLTRGDGCHAAHEVGGGFYHARVILIGTPGGGQIDARGALEVLNGFYTGATEIR